VKCTEATGAVNAAGLRPAGRKQTSDRLDAKGTET